MNIMELGAIGELVGGVAVIGSLIYVGLQVRQGARAQNAAAVDVAVGQLMAVQNQIAGDPELARVMYEGGLDRDALQRPEYFRFHLLARSFFIQFDSVRVKRDAGMVHDSLWHSERAFLISMMAAPGVLHWWEKNKQDFSPEMQAHTGRIKQSANASDGQDD